MKKFPFVPIYDRLVVKQIFDDEKTKGGLFIPEQAKDKKPTRGEIVSKGPKSKMKVGDSVLFADWVGVPVNLFGVDYLMMKDEDILATFK